MKRILLIVALLMFLATNITSASDDRFYWMFSDNKTGHFFDTKTIKYGYNYVSGTADKTTIDVWIKLVYSEEGAREEIASREKNGLPIKGFENLSHRLSHYTFSNKNRNCFIEYATYNKDGNVIDGHSFPSSYQQWTTLIPNTIGEKWYEEIWKYASIPSNSQRMEKEALK
jgi:hypothetical protein